MIDETAFLKAIVEDRDHAARLAFADWLEERGDPRAAWVRNPAIFRWMGPNAENPVPTLIRALSSADCKDAGDAHVALIALGEAAVPALVERLHAGGNDAWRAGDVLAQMGRAVLPALPQLLELICDDRQQVRFAAANALQAVGPAAAPALPDLIAILEDYDGEYVATNTLGAIGPAAIPAVPHLLGALLNEDRDQRDVFAKFGPGATPGIMELVRGMDRDWLVHALPPLHDYGAAAVPYLVDALHDDSTRVRAVAAVALAPSDPETALPHLITALEDEVGDEWFQRAVLEALKDMGEQAAPAVPVLQRLLDEYQNELSELIVAALHRIAGDGSSVPLLLEHLHSDNEYQQRGALAALAEMNNVPDEVIESVLILTQDESDNVRYLAVAALSRAATPERPLVIAALRTAMCEGDQSIRVCASAATGLRKVLSPAEFRAELLRALRSRRANTRCEAAAMLGEEELTPEVAAGLRRALGDGDSAVQLAAVQALARLGPVRAGAVDSLLQLLDDPSARVRAEVIGLLPEFALPAEEVVPRLRRELGESEPVCCKAAGALGCLGPAAADAVPDLFRLLDHRGPSADFTAAHALSRIGPAALVGLVERLRSADGRIREMAVVGLGQLAAIDADQLPLLTPLLRGDDPYFRAAALRALGAAKQAVAVVLPRLCRGLHDLDAEVRSAAADGLGKLGAAGLSALPDLLAVVSDSVSGVRKAAVRALAPVGGGRVAAIIPALLAALRDPDDQICAGATDGLASLGPAAASAIPALLPMLDARAGYVRARTIHILSRIGVASAKVVAGIRRALNDPENHVRELAASVLTTLESPTNARPCSSFRDGV